MDASAVMSMIGSLGFPIVACVMLYMRLEKQAEEHKEEVNKLTEAIHNNTLVMQKLIDKLEVPGDALRV